MRNLYKPTRCTLNSATLIDHIISNSNSNFSETSIIVSQLSDHFPLLFLIDFQNKSDKPKNINCRSFSDTNIRNFNDSLSTQSWERVLNLNDPQLSFTNFFDTFFKLYDTHLPMVSKKFNTNFHKIEPWFTLGLLTSRKKKISLTKEHFSNPSALSLSQLKTYRNLYNSVTRSAKKLYFEYELKANQNNIKNLGNSKIGN